MQNPCGWESWGWRSVIYWPKHHCLCGLSNFWYQLQHWFRWHVVNSQELGLPSNMSSENNCLSSSFLSLGVGYAVLMSCTGRQGSGCGESRFLLWGSYLAALQQCSGTSGINSPSKFLLDSQSQRNALLLGDERFPFKWCSGNCFDTVDLLVGKLFQYFASPLASSIFLISSLGLFVASFCLICPWVNEKKMNVECREWGLPRELVGKAVWAGHSPCHAAVV